MTVSRFPVPSATRSVPTVHAAGSRSAQRSVVNGLLAVACAVSAMAAQADTAQRVAAFPSTGMNELRMTPPDVPARACSADDFSTVAIRIGFHASLKACYREIRLDEHEATAFVTVPREFDYKRVSPEEFAALRADIARMETLQFKKSEASKTAGATPRNDNEAIALGVFDNNAGRIGYAYAFGIQSTDVAGRSVTQAMMRTETFVHVDETVVVVMIIAPVDSGKAAGAVFDVSERWSQAIVAANSPQARAWKPTLSVPQVLGDISDTR